MNKALLASVLKGVVGILAYVTVAPVFLFWRWTRTGASITMRAIPTGERGAAAVARRVSSHAANAFYGLYRFGRFVSRQWMVHYTEFGLRFYARRLARHYAGLGHHELLNLDDIEKKRIYAANSPSRLGPFIDAHPLVLDYRDGESFLDAGCGRGPELKELIARYPHSPVTGMDISELAVAVVRSATDGNPLVQVEQGSLTDLSRLSQFADASVDHVLLSHVIPYLMGEGIAETTRLRQAIFDHLIRIARRSVVILTDRIDRREHTSVEPLLTDAALIRDDVPGYLDRYLDIGQRYVLYTAPTSVAMVFRKYAQGLGSGR